MKRLRITGLVRLANQLRRELGAGMTPDRLQWWRRHVAVSLAHIGQLLQQHGATPEAMPAPSRRAYDFLRTFDWEKIPPPSAGDGPAPAPRLAWSGLGPFIDRTADALARQPLGPELDRIHQSVSLLSRRVEGSIERTGATELTPATRAARAWLAMFAQRPGLEAYVAAVRAATPPLEAAARALGHPHPVIVQFRPIRLIYRLHVAAGQTIVWLPAPMVAFGPSEFALVARLLATRSGEDKQRVVAAMSGEAYQNAQAQFESLGGLPDQTRGACHDLAQSFDRVNAAYFSGRMARPRLVWSRSFSGRKFGHYDAIRDTVMVSSTLDHATVPAFGIDYLIYHELLHKEMGATVIGGRRYSHTSEFAAAERRFSRFAEADEVLKKLAASIPSSA